jgi:hypothetical protein
MTRHDDFLECHRQLLAALVDESKHRRLNPDWEDRERAAMANAADQWCDTHPGCRRVDIDDIRRIEHRAMGHIDYGSKLALYVAELVYS